MEKRRAFELGAWVTAEEHSHPYRAAPSDPRSRKLSIFTQDPATSRFDAAIAEIAVPYEPLEPGPSGSLFVVHDYDDAARKLYPPVELDTLRLALTGGLAPSTTDPQYAQQMVYALAASTYEQFTRALGRYPTFGFEPDEWEKYPRLKLRPHALFEENAAYDPEAKEIAFGYYHAGAKSRWKTQPGDLVFTSLSHDVVVHELAHAMLDGMRTHFLLPTNPDVWAFHEGFSDLVAIFQRFRHKELVRHALGREQGALTSSLITDIARQFGQTGESGDGRTALRTAILDAGGADDDVPPKFRYERNRQEHDRGAVLVTAVFEAYRRVFDRKSERLRKLAAGRISDGLLDLLTDEACKLAAQFLNIVIRAVDYCPPVDLTFGEYLRALVTADADLVPDDPWGYREALILAFRRYGITVPNVPDLTEHSLRWCAPEPDLPAVEALAWNNLVQATHPMDDPGMAERVRRADAIGERIVAPVAAKCFGLSSTNRRESGAELPVVQSLRTFRRISPDREAYFGIVAEVTQRKRVRLSDNRSYWFHGGSTIVLDADGSMRYAISKWVDSKPRLTRFKDHVRTLDARDKEILRMDKQARSAMYRRLHMKR
jgi:hypothetical protein